MTELKSDSEKEDDPHELVEITEGLSPCKICLLPQNPEGLKVGPLYKLGDCQAHMFCLNFSSALEQKGEDEEGIKGFLCEDIVKEWRRASRLKCVYCGNKYATTGCCAKKCKKSYHFPCGLKAGGLFQFYGEFNAFCSSHRPVQKPSVHRGKEVVEDNQCGVCLDEVEELVSPATLWTPCCGGWFHRSCIEKMAENAGLAFFKCPLCCNKETFEKEMLEHGVYIPDQDAEWEKDNAYEDLYQRHNRCDVEVCVCPDGRFRDDVNMDDSPWEIFLCRICGHQGSHITCGNLDFEFPMFKCQPCLDIVRKLPNKPRPVFHSIAAKDEIQIVKASDDSSVDPVEKMSSMLAKTALFKVKGTTLDVTRSTSSLFFNISPLPAFDIPRPVKLGERKFEEIEDVPKKITSNDCQNSKIAGQSSSSKKSKLKLKNKNKLLLISLKNKKKLLSKRKKLSKEHYHSARHRKAYVRMKKLKNLDISFLHLSGSSGETYSTNYQNGHCKESSVKLKGSMKEKKKVEKNIEIIQLSSDSESSDEEKEPENFVNHTTIEKKKENSLFVGNGFSLSMVERTRSSQPKKPLEKKSKLSLDRKRKLKMIQRDSFIVKKPSISNGFSTNLKTLNGKYPSTDFSLLIDKSQQGICQKEINVHSHYTEVPDSDNETDSALKQIPPKNWVSNGSSSGSTPKQIPPINGISNGSSSPDRKRKRSSMSATPEWDRSRSSSPSTPAWKRNRSNRSSSSSRPEISSPENSQFFLHDDKDYEQQSRSPSPVVDSTETLTSRSPSPLVDITEDLSRSPSPEVDSTETFTFGAFCLKCGISFPNIAALETHSVIHSQASPR